MASLSEISTISQIVYHIPAIIHTIESVSSVLSNLKGKSKEDAAVALLQDTPELAAALQDPAVESAVRDVIKAVVSLHNATAKPAGK